VAIALELRSSEPQVIARLAHHYLRCHVLGYSREAVLHAAAAARVAEHSLAFEEAAIWFERGAGVPGIDPSERTDLLFAAAGNHTRAGAFARARAIHGQLATSRDPATRLRAAVGHEDASWRPGVPGSRSADLLAEALEATALEADDQRYIAALASLGRALTFSGQVQQSRLVGARAIDLAERHGDEALQAHALCASLWHGLTPADVHVQLERSTRVVAYARATGNADLLQPASYFRARASYILGRPAELESALLDYRRTSAGSAEPFIAYIGGCLDQGRSFMRGDLIGALRQAQELVELGQAFGTDDAEGSYGLQMFMAQRETGQLETVRHLVTGDEAFGGRWVPGLLALYTELGLEPGMRRALHHILSGGLSDERIAGSQWPAELAFTTEAALALHDTDALTQLQPHLVEFAGMNLVTGEFVATFGAADRYLARVAALFGDHARAEELFRSATALDQTMGSDVHLAETSLHHGLHLLATELDEPRAWGQLTRAREIAERIGQSRVLRQLPAHPDRGEGPDGLSAREVEVLRLLTEGLSNREIGERLYISGNTAANHVRSILMKTGAANRTQAAMYATDHHLV
jgi:DNA-binding CsgD family transcriptional regulator